MRYSEDLISQVLAGTDIVDLVGGYVKLKRSGANYMGLCPFHNEKTPSFSVSPSKQVYYCFGCHAGGNAITFLMEYNNDTFQEALEELADRAGVTLPKIEYSKEQKEREDRRKLLLEANKLAAEYYYYRLKTPEGETARKYLKGRGITDETILHFGLGYSDKYGNGLYQYLKQKGFRDEILKDSGLFLFDEKRGPSDKFWNRVMYPILDERGRVIGFGGRVMGDGKPKYLNSPETPLFNKRRHLYALNYARATREKYLILCEGYMDVITMHQAGFTNACASLGTALTSEQAALLRRFTGQVLLLYDSDGAGINAALRAIPILTDAGIRPRVVNLLPHKDPDEFIREEGADAFRARLTDAESGFLFEIDQLAKQYDLQDPDDKTQFQKAAAGKLLAFPDELERNNYTAAIAEKYHFSADGLTKMVSRLALSGTPASQYREPKKTGRSANKNERSDVSESLMLTYLANYPEAYEQTAGILSPRDFQDPVCRKIADILYAQLAAHAVSEAGVIAHFDEADEQRKAAAVFHTEIPVDSQEELDRAFTDTVLRIASVSNDAALRAWDGTDLVQFQELIEQKKKLENIRREGRVLHLPYTGN